MKLYLVAQSENTRVNSYYFGYEVFKEEGRNSFWMRFHTRTYQGMRVDSHWATEKVQMKSSTVNSAIIEARAALDLYVKSVCGVSYVT